MTALMCELRYRARVSMGQSDFPTRSVLQRQPLVLWRWWIAECCLLFLGVTRLCELIVEAMKELALVVRMTQLRWIVRGNLRVGLIYSAWSMRSGWIRNIFVSRVVGLFACTNGQAC